MTTSPDVLVAGAGPAGLTLALQAHDHGARVRIVERRPEAFRPSRALIVHSRTLEVLRPLGVTAGLLARADTAPQARLYLGSRIIHARLGDLAQPDTAFPHVSLLRQMDVERVLSAALADRGVRVERGTELISVRDDGDAARALLRSDRGAEEVTCRFVAGCDGAASTVRRQAGIGWRGGPYRLEVVLADADIDSRLTAGIAHVVARRHGLVFIFALGERAAWRLLMTRPARGEPPPFGTPGPPVPAEELQAMLDEAGMDVRITRLAWSARVGLQHRVAARFRRGRLFIAGDAAHAFSPATGQGMNTGIQDAANLGWKLAFAVRGTAGRSLLDSYDRERRPVAHEVLALTHLVFWAEASTGRIPSFLRGVVGPFVAPAGPALLGRRRLVAGGIRLVSQLRVGYAHSSLSVEGAPRRAVGPRAGQRLPDATVTCGGQRVRLHGLLASPGIHVLLHRDADQIDNVPFGPYVTVHRLTSSPGRGLVAVRPDGYVGFHSGKADVRQLSDWLAAVGGDGADDPGTG